MSEKKWIVIIFSTLFISGALFAQFAGGSGTPIDPWKIETATHLNNVRNYSDDHFIQLNDIDLFEATRAGGIFWNDGEGWESIGFFTGYYDGGNHCIEGLYINRPESNQFGLFGYLLDATIKNLYVKDVEITGWSQLGALAGLSIMSEIDSCESSGLLVGNDEIGGLVGVIDIQIGQPTFLTNCFSNAEIEGNIRIGGLVGVSRESIIQNCYATGLITGKGGIGGLVGENLGDIILSYAAGEINGESSVGGLAGSNKGNISRSYSHGIVTGDWIIGGLVGVSDSESIVSECFSTASVFGGNNAAGLIGSLTGSLADSYAMGSVTGIDYISGLVSHVQSPGVIERCYSTGVVTGNIFLGGLIAVINDGETHYSYWDTDTSGLLSSDGGSGKSTAEMKKQATFANWDFQSVWDIKSGFEKSYPFLRENPQEPAPGWESRNIFFSEICDNKSGESTNTGFIEIYNRLDSSIEIGGWLIEKGTIVAEQFVPNGVSYEIPSGVEIAGKGFVVIGNGAELNVFNAAWNVTLNENNYLKGSNDLSITSGFAYAINTGAKAMIEYSPEIQSGEKAVQNMPGDWMISNSPETGQPGSFGSDEGPLPVSLSTFNAAFLNHELTIYWATQSETNNSHWNLWRFEENSLTNAQKINYSPIVGAGTSSELTEYCYVDEKDVENYQTYFYWLESVDYTGQSEFFGAVSVFVEFPDEQAPPSSINWGLQQNYPNPFNPYTTIQFVVEEDSFATLKVYNTKGQKIKTLFEGEVTAEVFHNYHWDGKNESGKDVVSGVYFYRLETAVNSQTMKMILLK